MFNQLSGGTGVMEQPKERDGWLAAFSREVISMPRRHVLVFLVATLLLVVVEVELTEGWHLVHLVELMGVMVFLYLLWAAWRVPRGGADPRNLSSKSK
jgi:threonine/homoserine/homoserine lactone efflux protein